MAKLALNLITRGRPSSALKCAFITLNNIKRSDTRLMISVDSDDEATYAAVAQLRQFGAHIDVRAREDSLGAKVNRVLDVFPDADLYALMCDDGAHLTPGFDEIISDAAISVPDDYCVIVNHLCNLSFSPLQAVSRAIVEHMDNRLWQPYWPFWFGDHWIDDIARMIGRLVFADVIVDQSNTPPTQERRDITFWANLFDRLLPERLCQARGIIHARDFLLPPWHKELLCRNFPLVAERSLILNRIAVLQTQKSETAPETDRHKRLKERAKFLLDRYKDTQLLQEVA